MSRSLRFASFALALLVGAACTDAPTGSAGGTIGTARIGIAPSFSTAAAQTYGLLSQMGIDVTNVRITLTAPDGTTRDTVVAFPVGIETLSIELLVPGRTAGSTFTADVELRDASGTVLFRGTQFVVAQVVLPGATTGGSPPTPITITYTGPGATIKTVNVTPGTSALTGVQNVNLTATALDQNGASVSDVLVQWVTSDATVATVAATGNATATVSTTGKRGSATIRATSPTGITANATITVTPLATKVVVISGGGQSGVAGSTLAQPLVVEVQAADNIAVPGIPVTFRAVTAGGSVGTAAATADAAGRASTTLALGNTAGAYQFEVASGTLTGATVTATATPAPAARIEIESGNDQSTAVGTQAALPLTVRVFDQFGTPVNNATVTWTKVVGSGSLGSLSSTTGANGNASNTYTVGSSVATETIRASLSGVAGTDGSVLFTVRATAGAPALLSAFGSGQHAEVNTPLPQQLLARVADRFGNPVAGVGVYWLVTGNTSTTASFNPAASVTGADGFARTVATMGPTPGPLTITAVSGSATATFSATIDPAVSTGTPGTLSGSVYHAVNNTPLAGVSVTVKQGASTVASATTGAGGTFTTSSLPGGSYDVTFSASGFVTSSIVGQHISGNTQAQAVPMVPSSPDPGSISGTIINATTASAVTGTAVTVELRAGLNNLAGTPLQTVTTNTSGQYVFTGVTAGTYTVLARANGFSDGSKTGISVGATTTGNQNIVISPLGAAGNVRIVLTWFANPRDLDSYLTGPFSSPSVIYYGDSGNCSAPPFACLDTDITGGFGPETMTIAQPMPGTYRYSVRKFSGSGDLSASGAKVEVYVDNALARTFSVPPGSGIVWTVFEINGSTITPINTMGNSVQPGNNTNLSAPSALRSPGTKRNDIELIERVTRQTPKRANLPR